MNWLFIYFRFYSGLIQFSINFGLLSHYLYIFINKILFWKTLFFYRCRLLYFNFWNLGIFTLNFMTNLRIHALQFLFLFLIQFHSVIKGLNSVFWNRFSFIDAINTLSLFLSPWIVIFILVTFSFIPTIISLVSYFYFLIFNFFKFLNSLLFHFNWYIVSCRIAVYFIF